jgi:hypothetical protein
MQRWLFSLVAFVAMALTACASEASAIVVETTVERAYVNVGNQPVPMRAGDRRCITYSIAGVARRECRSVNDKDWERCYYTPVGRALPKGCY